MTTLAYRAGVLAADSLTCAGTIRDGDLAKIWRIGQVLAGFAGAVTTGLKFRDWVASGMKGDDPYRGQDHGNGLVISGAGIVCWSGSGCWPVTTEYYALGSGCEIATGAMAFGASARQAVEIAAQHDTATGGRIIELSL